MIRDAVAGYATRFHRLLAGQHAVASPFGAWLLLALLAPAARDGRRAELAAVLGMDVDAAYEAAGRLLSAPHAELVLGAAAWHDPDHRTEPLVRFLRRLAVHAETGPIPSQAAADEWVHTRTLGLIEHFPLDLDDGDPVVLLLATAIAAKVSWEVPFWPAPPETAVLPATSGFANLPLLREPGTAQWLGLVPTQAGLLAVLTVRSSRGLLVTSGVGDPAADPAAVLDATQQLAMSVAAGGPPPRLDLVDLPLGDGPAWRITEATTTRPLDELYEVLVPAWEATANHQLLAAELGFATAGAALIDLLPVGDYDIDARQSAMARYTREGFEAAAVTALGLVTTAAPFSAERRMRTARIEFTRPHAVVAATEGSGDWDGLPIFSAWVAKGIPAD